MLCKDQRIADEWNVLPVHNKRLAMILNMVANYSTHEFSKELIITCIYRSPTENSALYAQSVEPSWRPHTQWLAVDLRSSIYTDAEIQKLLSFLNSFTVFGGNRKCAIYHQIAGNAFHFHVQCDSAG